MHMHQKIYLKYDGMATGKKQREGGECHYNTTIGATELDKLHYHGGYYLCTILSNLILERGRTIQ